MMVWRAENVNVGPFAGQPKISENDPKSHQSHNN